MPPKRKASIAAIDDDENETPRKAPRLDSASVTPSARKSILRGTPSKLQALIDAEPTPKSLRKVLFSTPGKPEERDVDSVVETPTATRNDLSAKRRSRRALLERNPFEVGDSEDDDDDMAVAGAILDDEEADRSGSTSEEDDDDTIQLAEPPSEPNTPSKVPPSSTATKKKPRGRPKRPRTPSPPPDLPPHELYFFQNRTNGTKTSSNTLASNVLLNQEVYHTHITAYEDPHAKDIERLKRLHRRGFEQWVFELEEGFNIALYGYGSKRGVAMEFAEYYYHHYCSSSQNGNSKPKIVVVNGYTPGLGLRDILLPLHVLLTPGKPHATLPAQPATALSHILTLLSSIPSGPRILLIAHSLDHPSLRLSSPPLHPLLARLSAHPGIALLSTLDHPNFPLLLPSSQFRWVHHDATTHVPYALELGGNVAEDVNALLGRRKGRLRGREGVGFVVRSLPVNARGVFRLLVEMVLAETRDSPSLVPGSGSNNDNNNGYEDDDLLGASDDSTAAAESQHTPSRRIRRGRPARKPKAKPGPTQREHERERHTHPGIEFRTLYHRAVEQFLCSSELGLRTLLKEFQDHALVEMRDSGSGGGGGMGGGGGGGEMVGVLFSGREELEGVLGEIVG